MGSSSSFRLERGGLWCLVVLLLGGCGLLQEGEPRRHKTKQLVLNRSILQKKPSLLVANLADLGRDEINVLIDLGLVQLVHLR